MGLSIIIPTFNEENYIGSLLDSIVTQSVGLPCEVIVVDASSNPKTVHKAEAFSEKMNLKILKSTIADVGTQRNLGASMSGNTYLLFIDADVTLGPDVIRKCIRQLQPSELGIVSIRHRSDRAHLGIQVLLILVYSLILLARLFRYPVTNGDFLLTNATTYQAVQGFKENFLLGEDTDFGMRARRAGARNYLVWRSSVTASSRRLSKMSGHRLVFAWATAYLRAVRGKGPTGTRADDSGYPFGKWS